MKSSSLVSVIIPVYNTPKKYLIECLESVKRQDYKNIEVILVDDGSDKGTARLLDDFVNKIKRESPGYMWQVIHQKNKGLSAARNSGYRVATGKYVQFLDADDYFDSKLISSVVAKAEKTKAEVVVENFIIKDYSTGAERSVLQTNTLPDSDTFALHDLNDKRLETIPYNVWSKLFRKDFLDGNNLLHSEKLLRSEDVLFSCAALTLAKRIAVVYETHITYRDNLPSSNSKTNDKFPSASIDAWKELRSVLEKNKLYELYKKDFETAMLGGVSWHIHKLHTVKGKKELAAMAQAFMSEINSTAINDHTTTIALASVNPEFLDFMEDKNQQIQFLNGYVKELESRLREANNELSRLRTPGVKHASRKLAGAVKRKLQRSATNQKEMMNEE